MRISDWSSDVCSSDLPCAGSLQPRPDPPSQRQSADDGAHRRGVAHAGSRRPCPCDPVGGWRSEEHTSELQSLMRISYAVFCLKKKKTDYSNVPQTQTSNGHVIVTRRVHSTYNP